MRNISYTSKRMTGIKVTQFGINFKEFYGSLTGLFKEGNIGILFYT